MSVSRVKSRTWHKSRASECGRDLGLSLAIWACQVKKCSKVFVPALLWGRLGTNTYIAFSFVAFEFSSMKIYLCIYLFVLKNYF